jgi:ATP-binding protein involved in chromosome partitioning
MRELNMAGSNGKITQADVLNALSSVHLPGNAGDVVSRNMVREIKICEGSVAFQLLLPDFPAPLQEQLQRECRTAVENIPGVRLVNVRAVTASTPVGGRSDFLPGVRRIIAIASGKGGVGKSTVATNLAVALAQDGARTGLLDADIYGPSIPTMMGIHRPPFVEEGQILPVEQHQVKMMSLGLLQPQTATPVIWRGPMVGGAVKQMLVDVRWGELDYLLVDLPPGTGDAQLTLAQTVPLTGTLIVMTSQDVAVNIASKALAMFQKLNVPVLGIVENMSTFLCPHCQQETEIFTHGGGESAAERLGVRFLGAIPLDPSVVRHGDEGTPTVAAAPKSGQAEAFRAVARALVNEVTELEFADGDAAASSQAKDPLGGLMGRFRSS